MIATRPADMTGRGYPRRFDVGVLPKPTVTGPWSAWLNVLSEADRKESPAGLCLWFLHAPGAHPLWPWHAVLVCALRDFPGLPPAKVHAPGNSHEILIGALDPEWDPLPHIDKLGASRWGAALLRPVNMVHQVSGLTDEQAVELAHLLTRAFCNGVSSPDDDFKMSNIAMIAATADHLRRGMHMPS